MLGHKTSLSKFTNLKSYQISFLTSLVQEENWKIHEYMEIKQCCSPEQPIDQRWNWEIKKYWDKWKVETIQFTYPTFYRCLSKYVLNCFLVTIDKVILEKGLLSLNFCFFIFLQQITRLVLERWSVLPIPMMDLVLWLWKRTVPSSGPWLSKTDPLTNTQSCASDLPHLPTTSCSTRTVYLGWQESKPVTGKPSSFKGVNVWMIHVTYMTDLNFTVGKKSLFVKKIK